MKKSIACVLMGLAVASFSMLSFADDADATKATPPAPAKHQHHVKHHHVKPAQDKKSA